MSFSSDPTLAATAGGGDFRPSFGREAAFLVETHETELGAGRKLGMEASFLGSSEAVRCLQAAAEKVSQSGLPVLIEAEFGTDELAVANAIHCAGSRKEKRLVVLNCASQQPSTFRTELVACLGKAQDGSLFLRSVDELDYAMQKELLSLPGLFNLSDPHVERADVRVMASASRPLLDLVKEGHFLRFLRTEIEVLKIEVPPLRSRPEDLNLLIGHELKKYEHHGRKRFSPEALAACEAYPWPENFLELRRAVAQLVVMTDGDCIDVNDLRQHLGWPGSENWKNGSFEQNSPDSQENASPEVAPADDTNADGGDQSFFPDKRIVELARDLIAGRFEDLGRFGPGIERALTYITRNFDHEISLGELARQSHFSPSHLSFLFKKTLGISFKGILAAVRIEKARQLLIEKPHDSITEISLDVGFGDLSHFEKTFKRTTGVNPREYRRRKLEELAAFSPGI